MSLEDHNRFLYERVMCLVRAAAQERRLRRELAAIEVQAWKRGNPRVAVSSRQDTP